MGMPTWEDIAKEVEKYAQEDEIFEKHLEELRHNELTRKEPKTLKKENKNFYGNCDHPSTIENGTATFFWIIIMIVSMLFDGGWILCILETIIWAKFITRHND